MDVDQLGFPNQPVFALKPTEARTPVPCCLAYLNSTVDGLDYDRFVLGDPDRVNYDRGLVAKSRISVKSLTLTSVWDQPLATVKIIAGLRENEDVANRVDGDASPSKIVDALQTNENFQQSYEFQVTGSSFGDRLGWVAGLVYFDESGSESAVTRAFTAIDRLDLIQPVVTPGDIDNDSIGGYAQGSYSLTPRLRVNGGIRHTRDGKRLVLRATMGPLCAVPPSLRDDGNTCKGTFDDSFRNTSFLAGTDYRYRGRLRVR